MQLLIILYLLLSITFPVRAGSLPVRTKPQPKCFPSGPACLRPRLDECREAIMEMRYTDPGYQTVLGRHVDYIPHSINLPRKWASEPRNCVVKLDVTSPEAREGLRLRTLTTPAEEIIEACITGGTKCGGKIIVGKLKVLELTVGYYSAVGLEGLIEAARFNATRDGHPTVLRLDGSGNTTRFIL